MELSHTKQIIIQYIKEVNEIYKRGNATEHSYRHALIPLLKKIRPDLTVTNEPKRIGCGAPDYIVTRNEIPVGYIEAKDVGTDLNHKSHNEQFDRYKKALNNLIITDYLTFQLFVDGVFITSATIAIKEKNGIVPDKNQFDAFATLIDSFVGYEGQSITTSLQLSKIMAAKARLLAKTIENVLDEEINTFKMEFNDDSSLMGQLKAFKDVMQKEMTHKEFADVYAQTIAYGMFAAKINDTSNTPFNRNKAAQLIPQSNPFLRKLFQVIAGYDVDVRICWIVDDLANLFTYASIYDINKEFDKIGNDAMIHFYETFLSEYDPTEKKRRGVWYTPQPVVRFIVKAVDDILKQDFGITKGLANNEKITVIQKNDKNKDVPRTYHRVQILDPATGTGTFLAEVVEEILESNTEEEGMLDNLVANDLIPRINGFEILMASYAMAHLKLDLLLQKKGYIPTKDERLRIYLTNSLEEPRAGSGAQFAQWLSHEAKEASRIKREVPVMVVLGNPPYSGESQNKSQNKKIRSWIERLLEDYKKEPDKENTVGQKLEEKNSKWINDDYVKFIRFGQYFIEKNREGVLAFITNHSFLDNPTFRGMRWNLLKTFDKIYILDLHGNAKKKETAPDGSKDENVFDIQQGVSINIFIKTGSASNKELNPLATVFHADLYGKRFDKYNFLINNNLSSVQWKELELSAPQFFFVQKDFSLKEEYEKGVKIQELFPVNSVGIVTARDNFTIHDTAQAVKNTINEFIKLDVETARSRFNLGKDARDWSVKGAINDLLPEPIFKKIVEINYRPFDKRFTYYTGKSKGFHCMPRGNVMQHFVNGENVGLIFKRGFTENAPPIFISNSIIEFRSWSRPGMQGGDYVTPLYLFHKQADTENTIVRTTNLLPLIVERIAKIINLEYVTEKSDDKNSFAPIDLLDYIYAVLHSPTYRERYKEFLKIDFPRVPYPENTEKFWALVELGGKLRGLHLMENIEPQKGMATYRVRGTHEVEKIKYEDNRVYINDSQYFVNVPLVAWNFYIGGYQPAQKWLKDRKEKKLNNEDVSHYRKIIRVLVETAEIMKEIDKVIGNK